MAKTRTIAIMGANSQIARCLTEYYARQQEVRLVLFSHRAEICRAFLARQCITATVHDGYATFADSHFDILFNCVGAGTPAVLQNNYLSWFELLERYDNLALRQLQKHCPEALYVNFSSGAVYGRQGRAPAQADTCNCLAVNHITPAEYYTVIRLNAEAKHRAHTALRIVDLRIFSFFCRHTPPESGYFLSDILQALLKASVLQTSPAEMVRDYVHPEDLCALIELCAQQESLNTALDVYSAAPCRKSELLSLFQREFGLRYEYSALVSSPNGDCEIYFSAYQAARAIGYSPHFTSLAGLQQEMTYALKQQQSAKSQL